MILQFTDQAQEDLEHWKAHDQQKVGQIKKWLTNIMEIPYSGIGTPEALKYGLQDYWSRRVDHEHRLVYKVTDEEVIVVACRYHYSR